MVVPIKLKRIAVLAALCAGFALIPSAFADEVNYAPMYPVQPKVIQPVVQRPTVLSTVNTSAHPYDVRRPQTRTITTSSRYLSTSTATRIVERPVYIEKPVERIVERVVEKPVYIERPVERVVERIVERPVERIIERPVERIVHQPVYIDRPVAVPTPVPVYQTRTVPVPTPVPVYQTRTVTVPTPVPVQTHSYRPAPQPTSYSFNATKGFKPYPYQQSRAGWNEPYYNGGGAQVNFAPHIPRAY